LRGLNPKLDVSDSAEILRFGPVYVHAILPGNAFIPALERRCCKCARLLFLK
jgi:hypothetical protein